MQFPVWVDNWVAPLEIRKWLPYYITGYDEDGIPIYVMEYGKWRYAQALANKNEEGRAQTKKTIAKYLMQVSYRMWRDAIANGGQGIAGIMDWAGFTFANFADPDAIQLALRPFAMMNKFSVYLNYVLLINGKDGAELSA